MLVFIGKRHFLFSLSKEPRPPPAYFPLPLPLCASRQRTNPQIDRETTAKQPAVSLLATIIRFSEPPLFVIIAARIPLLTNRPRCPRLQGWGCPVNTQMKKSVQDIAGRSIAAPDCAATGWYSERNSGYTTHLGGIYGAAELSELRITGKDLRRGKLDHKSRITSRRPACQNDTN